MINILHSLTQFTCVVVVVLYSPNNRTVEIYATFGELPVEHMLI